jgi:L-ascorbate metabolism protein UlaG (beta-lactamase superfamily)
VLTDPMLGARGPDAFVLPRHPSTGELGAHVARYLEPASFNVSEVDVVIVSHTHNDHVDARAMAVLPKDRPVIVTVSGAPAMRSAGFLDVRSLDWGEEATLRVRGATLRVIAVPAHHAHDERLDRELGRGNGYVLEFRGASDPYRVYWTGDAVVSDDSRDFVARYGAVDLLLPHMGGVGGDGGLGLRTMNAEEAVEVVRRVNPRWVLPIHHTTFGHYREPIDALRERAAEANLAARFRFLVTGESVPLP